MWHKSFKPRICTHLDVLVYATAHTPWHKAYLQKAGPSVYKHTVLIFVLYQWHRYVCLVIQSYPHLRVQHRVSRLTQVLPISCIHCSLYTPLFASLGLFPAGETVVVARGSSAKPVVERVPLPAVAAEPACIRLQPQQVRLSGLATALFPAHPILT